MTGTGTLSGFVRDVVIPVTCETDQGPRIGTAPVIPH